MTEINLTGMLTLCLRRPLGAMRRAWYNAAARHYTMSADVEEQRAREAQMNVAYYQKRAALAQSLAGSEYVRPIKVSRLANVKSDGLYDRVVSAFRGGRERHPGST